VRDRAGESYPDLPIDDRAADLWEPLVSVADLAGGAWPQLARDAAEALVESAAEDDTARSTNLQLLDDIRTVLDAKFMKSSDLCSKLRGISESPWEQYELNPSRLGRRLREYSITTRHSEDKTERGYHREDFADAFTRYLPPAEKVSQGVRGVPHDFDQQQKPDTMTESDMSGETSEGVGDAIAEAKSSADNTISEPVPDTLDTFGHLLAEQGARPSPQPCRGIDI
jgi:hypothetical protein